MQFLARQGKILILIKKSGYCHRGDILSSDPGGYGHQENQNFVINKSQLRLTALGAQC